MAIVDSLLTVLRNWSEAKAQERARVVTYVRKIAAASLQFRDSLVRVQQGEEADVWVLQEKASLIGQYYKHLYSVFDGKINSELLDQLAVYLARISIADNRPLTYLQDELESRARSTAKDHATYQIWIPPHGRDEAPIIDIEGEQAPSFDDCLHELSTLAAQIHALADAIEAGGDYR